MGTVIAALLFFIALMVGAITVLFRSDKYAPSNNWSGLLHDSQFWGGLVLMFGGALLLMLMLVRVY